MMIPKIIHYTWFSNDEMPPVVKLCIETWKVVLPDYKLKKWNMESIRNIDSVFLKEAILEKKWAYAADFVRLYAVYYYGGIYLDTDVMVLRSFDEFLVNKCFIGKENSIHFYGNFSSHYLSSHCFGAEKNHPFIKECLDYYEDRHFVTSKNQKLPIPLRNNFVLLPYIQAEIARQFGYDWRPLTQNIQYCNDGLVVYPTMYFDVQNKLKSQLVVI